MVEFRKIDNVIDAATWLSEIDKQFIVLERQRTEIRNQAKLISEQCDDRRNSNSD